MLRSLTSLRFAAALLVFFWHAALTRPAAMVLSLGYIGVGFFYLLSGFILTYTYAALFSATGPAAGSLRAFFAARFARIYPTHIFTMVVTLLILIVVGGEHWSGAAPATRTTEIATQALLVQSWFAPDAIHFGINGPAWSISDEALFYALFPLLAMAIARLIGGSGARAILFWAVGIWALFTAALVPVHATFDQWNLYVFPPIRVVDFVIGMLLGFAFVRRTHAQPRISPTLLEVCAIAGLLAGIGLVAFTPKSMHFSAAMMPFSAFAIYVFALQSGAVSRLLGAPVCVRLGEASYAFYLIHLDVVQLVERAFGYHHLVSCWFIALALSTGAALLIFTYVETPMRRRLRAMLAPRTASAHPQPSPA